MRNRALLLGIIGLGLCLIGWAIFGRETDEEAIRRRLMELSTKVSIDPSEGIVVRGFRLKRDLPDYLAEDAKFHVPQVGGDMSRGEVIASAIGAATRWPSAQIGWSGVEVTLGGPSAAHLQGLAELTRRDDGGARSTERKITIDWVKRDGDWMVQSLDVGDAPNEE